jgi:ribosome biogenesis SPOUT family RNA methylase Rps3
MTLPEVSEKRRITSLIPSDLALLADRTSELRKKGYQGRRLGPVQMTTDTAVRVTRITVQDRSKMP